MKYLSIRLVIALLTFVIGVYVTSQVNRAAYYIWPDVDLQPKIAYDHPERKSCVRMIVKNAEFRLSD